MPNSQLSHRQLPSASQIEAAVADPNRLEAVRFSESWRADAKALWGTLTSLAVRILDVPVSFVAVVKLDHDEYSGQCGLPEGLGDTPQRAGQTFCQFTVALNEMLVIGDTHQHEQTRDVSTVASLGIRAYIGVPLRVEGQVIGTFCVVDTVPRAWDSTALDTVAQLAASAERELTLRRALELGAAHAQRASHLAQQREALVATVSHDLRTPLQVVQMTAQMLKKKVGSTEQLQVDRILQASQSLRRLADALISERELEEAHTLRQPTSLRGLVDSSVGMR
jgi:GAF domain-containing protein